MPIFQVSLYVCLTLLGSDKLLASKTCQWEAKAEYFQQEAACEAFGYGEVGRAILSDVYYVNGTQIVEAHRCLEHRAR